MTFQTREVYVGDVGVGNKNPIRIQSMTTTPTSDVQATLDQILKLVDHGCELARVTVQGMKEALACEAIKNRLLQKGCTIPLIADIHFYPPAAMTALDFVDKVRINPGNFVDRRATDKADYERALEKIEEKFAPLVEKCKRQKKPVRIGTNHGSLSDRIMNRFGDTPMGMVESALEFTRIARKYDFHDIIFSMKASSPLVMIEAYRLLVKEMLTLGWDYPLHLGVTEAGAGEDGRVKSAVGIGALLLDGLGDTIRVSLTEDPWHEIEPAKTLVSLAESYKQEKTFPPLKRQVVFNSLPLHPQGSVVALQAAEQAPPDFILDEKDPRFCRIQDEEEWRSLLTKKPQCILFAPKNNRLSIGRKFFAWLQNHGITTPVILDFAYDNEALIEAAAECGALLADNLGEGILLRSPASQEARCKLSFAILQACRKRLTKTEFISCPGCGRTLFNLQEVSKLIREKTAHLLGVKIAIMGCIVNGPGEMADADFGYVGAAAGKIDLYIGKKCVEKGIDASVAPEKLITLIKAHGRWVEKI